MNHAAKADAIQQAIDLLGNAIGKLDENDIFSAEVTIGVAIHLLECSKTDLNHYLETETKLRALLRDQSDFPSLVGE
jgi:hypothetical protein